MMGVTAYVVKGFRLNLGLWVLDRGGAMMRS